MNFEESQLIIWFSVVSAACEDFNSSILQLEAQESLGDIVATSAAKSSSSSSCVWVAVSSSSPL